MKRHFGDEILNIILMYPVRNFFSFFFPNPFVCFQVEASLFSGSPTRCSFISEQADGDVLIMCVLEMFLGRHANIDLENVSCL